MEEIKVGEYVRTKRGIAQITDLVCGQDAYFDTENIFESNDIDFYRNNGIDIYGSFFRDLVVKHSPNIIDLIEEGDYVNGTEVVTVYGYDRYGNDKDELGIIEVVGEEAWGIYLTDIKKIKNIVTKEQFEQMKYIVGDESNVKD